MIRALSSLFSEGETSTGFIQSSRFVDVAIDVAEHVQHFGDADLVLGFARVAPDCRDDVVGMGFDCRPEPAQFRLALFSRRGLHFPLMRFLQREDALDVGCGIGHVWSPGLAARIVAPACRGDCRTSPQALSSVPGAT